MKFCKKISTIVRVRRDGIKTEGEKADIATNDSAMSSFDWIGMAFTESSFCDTNR